MKGKISFLTLFATIMPAVAQTTGINDVVEKLASAKNYHSAATVDVQLPQGAEVAYSLNLWSSATDTDPLSPASYLIEWTLPTPSGVSEGFTSYNNGNLFRHSDTRLQEYHFQWDSIPFTINSGKSGVQRNSQFTNMLPQFIADQINEIATKPGWIYKFIPDTITSGKKAAVIEARYIVNDIVAKNSLYVLDPETYLPRLIEIENNPASISEQILVMKFTDTDSQPIPASTEEDLIDRYPDVFDNYRESNFSVETLRGKALPAFSLPTATAERYTHQKGDPFRSPTLIAIFDPSIASTPDVVSALRNAASMSVVPADIIFATITNNIDQAEEATGNIREGEHLLVSARPLARDCGITSFPTILVVKPSGEVTDVVIGFSKDLSAKLLEKIILAR